MSILKEFKSYNPTEDSLVIFANQLGKNTKDLTSSDLATYVNWVKIYSIELNKLLSKETKND